MEVRIQSIHFDASEQLQSFIQKKALKLERFHDDIKVVEVQLKVVKPESAENKEAGIKMIVPNANFMQVKYVILLNNLLTKRLRLWRSNWLSTRKSLEINKNSANVLR